jgi:putative tryptophan/tyrosine transport system substrate-binding protein
VRRRDFAVVICSAALMLSGSAAAQPAKVWRIGHIIPAGNKEYAEALEQRLADLGDVEGRNIALLNRFPGTQPDKIEEVILSLLPQIDLLVVWGSIAGMAAKKLAGAVPVVFVSIGFPVEIGLVQSLAHPGGNITGIAAEAATETNEKRLQILKELVPDLKRVAVLRVPDDQYVAIAVTSLELAARKLGVTLLPVDIKSAGDLEGAFADMKKSGAQAIFVTGAALVLSLAKPIADLALVARLPSCHIFREAVAAGGLVSLGPDRTEMTRPAAAQIDKIIKGTSPSDIPVEQPTKFELVINLKTTRLLNLAIPHHCSRWPTRSSNKARALPY